MKITFLKCCSIALAMLLTSEIIYATPISIQFSGTVTHFNSSGVVNGIAVNNAFQVIVTYDAAAIDSITTAEAGRYLGGINAGMIVTSGVNQFTISGPMRVWTEDNVQDGFLAQWQGDDASFVWGDSHMQGNASLTLRDILGAALDSDALPSGINLTDWTGEKSFYAAAGNGLGTFQMMGTITSASRVPETLPTGLTLACVAMVFCLWKTRA